MTAVGGHDANQAGVKEGAYEIIGRVSLSVLQGSGAVGAVVVNSKRSGREGY